MSFTLEPKSNANTENIAHSVELTPQQLIQAVQELYGREAEGAPLRTSTMQELSGRMAIYSSYVQGNAGPEEDIQEVPGRGGTRTQDEWSGLVQEQGSDPWSKSTHKDL